MHTFEQAQSIRYYRQRFSEMPVGDPLNGAAYGEYLKSKGVGMIIGVVAAVAAVATGGATLAAYAAGTAGVSLGSAIAAGAMVAGGVMSGVGAVTGNTKLTKIGGILTLAGGIGSIAAGMVSGGASAAGVAEGGAGTQAEILAAQDAAIGQGAAEMTAEAAKSSTNFQATLVDNIAKTAEVPAAFSPPPADATAGASVMGDTSTAGAFGPNQTPPIQDVGSSIPKAPDLGGGLSQPADAASGATAPVVAGKQGGFLSNAVEVTKEAASGIGKFAKDNKELLEIGGKALMGLQSEGAEGTKELQEAKATNYTAQADANTAQAEALRAKTAAEAQKIANRNKVVLMLDPKSPTYQAEKANAIAKGIPWMDFKPELSKLNTNTTPVSQQISR